ncbi:class I SAM-dependent methyltransferase [Streptomyces sp. NPDC053755]|uniref:class I SAM-dependent methyltransferase n=1 Tax=Streptomyces sp. NPDC053755 TaxID=3155815 RepID=UPI00344148BE
MRLHDIDLGPAEGENAVFLATQGVEVTAVDFSAVQITRARRFWTGTPRLTFVHAEACTFLDKDTRQFEAITPTSCSPVSPHVSHRAVSSASPTVSRSSASTEPSRWAGSGWRAARAS